MKRTKVNLRSQFKRRIAKGVKKPPTYDGDIGNVFSTGSTLLDLEITGGRVYGGGIPAGILVEIFGPNSCGKSVLLSFLAGAIQRQGGKVQFKDPESRLNKKFAELQGMKADKVDLSQPDTVPEVFAPIRSWNPTPKDKVHGIFADSLAALSTKLEMTKAEGDKMGGRRAKEFSQECRKTCRVLVKKNFLMACSNQIRQKMDAGPFESKIAVPGGEAIGFYASLRLRCFPPNELKAKKTIAGKEVKKAYGILTQVKVFKSSVWRPYGIAPVYIVFDYGIDDIRANLIYLKKFTQSTSYCAGKHHKLHKHLDDAIQLVERHGLRNELKKETIKLWKQIEDKFKVNRVSRF